MIADERKKRITEAMKDASLDALLVYGNAWQGDYLRYATNFGILEGQALAIVRSDGHITLYVDSALEADRAALDCPDVDASTARSGRRGRPGDEPDAHQHWAALQRPSRRIAALETSPRRPVCRPP
jgi:hypothetical protein